jgi:serine/threonine protein kinase
MATTSRIMSPGDTLGGYRVLDVLGIGGMAVVYRAEQVSLGREVALKVLAPELSRDEEFRERFRREGKNVAALDHTHVVTVHDSGEVDGRFYIAMRLVKGSTLADRMSDGMDAHDLLRILRPIADALDTAHSIGLVHRDVKPQNILVSGRGEVYLADFGVAKGGQTQGLTATGSFVGSFNYAAPEQALGEPTSAATDIYALTAVAFQCLTGQVPYPRDTDAGVLIAHISAPPPEVRGPYANEFNRILARGMAKKPGERFKTAGELVDGMTEAINLMTAEEQVAVPLLQSAAPRETPLSSFDAARLSVSDKTEARADTEIGPADPTLVSGVHVDKTELDDPVAETAVGDPVGATAVDVPVAETAVGGPVGETAVDGPVREAEVDRPAGQGKPIERAGGTKRRAREGRGRAPFLAGGALLLAAAVAAVIVASGSSSGHRHAGGVVKGRNTHPIAPAPTTRTATAGPLSIAYPSTWHTSTATTGGSTALAASAIVLSDGPSTLEAGPVKNSAAVPAGPPPHLVAQYGRPAASVNATVAHDSGRAYTWTQGGNVYIVHVLGTAGGDLAIVCSGAAGTSLSACATLAQSAVVASSVQVLAPGPDAALAGALKATLAPVASARNALRDLKQSSLGARVGPADRVAGAERTAAAAVERLTVPARYARAVANLHAALLAESAAFTALAKDARSVNRSGYDGSVHAVHAAGVGLRTAAGALAAAQLGAPRFAALSLASAPAAPVISSSGGSPAVSPTSTPTPVTPTPVTPTPVTPTPVTPTPSSGGSSSGGSSGGFSCTHNCTSSGA